MAEILNQRPNYHKKETIIVIENFRRAALRKLFLLSNKNWQKEQLIRLQFIKVPFLYKKWPLQQNLLLKLPTIHCFTKL